MKSIKYKCGRKDLTIEFFDSTHELPYHRYFLSLKMLLFSDNVGDSVGGLLSDIEKSIKVMDTDKDKSKLFLQNACNRIHFVGAEAHLNLASTFPLIYSINGEVLSEELSIDSCIELAKKYSKYIPLSAIKKKTSFWMRLKARLFHED